MTNEEIMELTSEQLETRMSEIKEAIETNAEGTDFEALSLELDSIKERKSFLAEEQRKADLAAVIAEEGTKETNIDTKEKREMADIKEIRASKEYVEAYAEYIKTEDDTQCRALLTENVSGVVPVPVFVEDYVNTAWADNKILARVRKINVKGNVKIGFEVTADGAVIHTEGAAAPTEEKIALGIVTLVPASVKKWITISDEVMDMKGEAFLRYIYDELTYQIAKKIEDEIIAKIEACASASTNTPTTNVGVPVIASTATLAVFAEALSELSDRATNPVIIMNKKSYGQFKGLQLAANYGVDVFEGMDVLFNDTIEAYSAATTGVTYAIVGDLGVGMLANFPNGDDINIKTDDLSLAEKDLVKFVGREYVGLGVVAPNAFVKIQAPATES